MSLKTISIGAVARALAATALLGAVAIPAVAAAQSTPAQQAVALAQAIAAAVEQAVQVSTPDTVQANVAAAIANAIDGADPQVAQVALQQANALVMAALPSLAGTPVMQAAATVVQQSIQTAFVQQSTIVTAALGFDRRRGQPRSVEQRQQRQR